jgi:streptogramin lyase
LTAEPVELGGMISPRAVAIVATLALFFVSGIVCAAETQQRVTVRISGCGDCAKNPPTPNLWDESQDAEIHPTISDRDLNGFAISLAPGYYRMELATHSCQGDRYLGVLAGHNRPFDVAMICGKPSIRIVDGMHGLAGSVPASVKSITMQPVNGREDPIPGTVSDGAYYFDEASCGDCVLDLTLADGNRSRIGSTTPDESNFALVRDDLTEAAVSAGISVHGSPFNSPEQLVEGPSGSIWVLDRIGNRVADIKPGQRCREFDLPTPFADAADIIGTSQFVWVSERRPENIVRFASDGTYAEFPISLPQNEISPNIENFRMVLGHDGRVWYINGSTIGAMDKQGKTTLYSDGKPVFWLRNLALGADGRIWVVGLSTPLNGGTPFMAAIDSLGRWQRFPLAHDNAVILAGKNGSWVAGDYDFLSYVDLRGNETPLVLPTANMRPQLYAVDASDDIWFSDRYGNMIARATPNGRVTTTYTQYGPAGISDMQVDQSGNVWIAEPMARAIEEYKTEFEVSPPGIRPSRLLVDSSGQLWYSDGAADVIGVIAKSGSNKCYALALAQVRSCAFQKISVVTSTEP